MLRLEKMQIVGFKSFGDRTEVVFPEGITAVVGPNGCGKSNIGDAINWVLGEQSAKMLRGSAMEDVIFNGTERRKPQGMAEVSLHLAGKNGAPERREVVLTRRLFRSGDSEYLINGERSRLKDIQDLLGEARVGAKTYATIEQGRIDQILNAKPKERRLILEEAAGISGFKHKRRLTELKLDATQANLLRVNDILTEVRRQINALKRQAARARRYGRLREELRSRHSVRFAVRARTQDADLAAVREEERAAREGEAAAAARLGGLEAELASERLALDEDARSLHARREQLHQIEMRVGDDEGRIRAARERIEEGEGAAARLDAEAESLTVRRRALLQAAEHLQASEETLRRETDELKAALDLRQGSLDEIDAKLRDVREAIEHARNRLVESMTRAVEARNRRSAIEEARARCIAQRERRLAERDHAHGDLTRHEAEAELLRRDEAAQRSGLDEVERAHVAASSELVLSKQTLTGATEDLAQARGREQSAAARLRTLEDVATRFAGVSDGVRAVLQSGPAAGIRNLGVVADYLEAGEEIEAAAEAYLGGFLPTVLLESGSDACAAAALLAGQGAGRATFLCRDQPAGGPVVGAAIQGSTAPPEEVLRHPSVLGRLRDRLELQGGNGFLRDRIGDALLVDRLESALTLHRIWPHVDYLTRGGEVVYASGLVAAGGRQAADHGMLAHARRIHQSRAEHSAACSQVAESQMRCDAAREAAGVAEATVADLRQRLEDGRRGLVEVSLRAQRSGDEARRTGRAAEVLGEELAALDEEARSLETQLAEIGGVVAEAERVHAAQQSDLEVRIGESESLEDDRRRFAEEVSTLREEVAVHRQSLVAAEKERLRRDQEIVDLGEGFAARSAEAVLARERVRESHEIVRRTEVELVTLLAERQEVAERVTADDAALCARRAGLADREDSQRDAKGLLEGERERARSAELSRARAEADRRYLDDLCVQELGCSAAEAAAAALAAGASLDEANPEELESQIADLADRIDKIGPVNMMAIEEFTELETRHGFLSTQQLDLEQAITSLRDTIRRINASSREQFLTSFEQVRASYQEIFQVLFGGGKADLRLEEGEDVLECGIEILAQPPGKKLGSVGLMSGGEKAMAAIALLFAIFRYQPSPFCLLDEVDAALDDLNVNRFTRMLREYSGTTQFILITHNKLSMDSANLLYGVTMEEPGVSRLVSLKLD